MFQIRQYDNKDEKLWDDYIVSHPGATCYHLTAWKRAVERAYSHKSYYLIAWASSSGSGCPNRDGIVGVLPLFHLKHFLLGNSLVSLPFCDYGGILANVEEVASAFLRESLDLSRKLATAMLELRSIENRPSDQLTTYSPKVRMVLDLNGDSEKLWNRFSSKLRSQIRKPEKEGLVFRLGNVELLHDFYKVFSFNMRDLGSPVHSKALIRAVLEEFRESSKLQLLYKGKIPVGAGLIICFRDTVFIPWASTIRQFNRLSPNMMLYWNFLKYATDEGFRKFDFGRSSPQEGTYKFKEQWGAKPTPLYWQYGSRKYPQGVPHDLLGKERYSSLVSLWKRLPLPLANMMGPFIRKHISL